MLNDVGVELNSYGDFAITRVCITGLNLAGVPSPLTLAEVIFATHCRFLTINGFHNLVARHALEFAR